MRRLTGNEDLGSEFATEWPLNDIDPKTRAVLTYATKLTDTPILVDDADLATLKASGWDEREVWQATAQISFLNFTGRMVVASGLAPDEVPTHARLHEARPDKQGAVELRRAKGRRRTCQTLDPVDQSMCVGA